jgi:hypothetical protein
MRRRRLRRGRAGLVALLVAAAFASVVVWPRTNRLTRESFQRIREGTTRVEAEAILGPPGDYRTRPTVPGVNKDYLSDIQLVTRGDGGTAENWFGDEMLLMVVFDSEDRAVLVNACQPPSHPVGPFESLRWRVNRLWHRWFPEK